MSHQLYLYTYKNEQYNLEGYCKERGISLLKPNGKKKLKKELYDEINLYEIKKG